MKSNNSLWYTIWISQKKKCKACGRFVKLDNSWKKGRSFDILCKKCFNKSDVALVVLDDMEEMKI